jgi:hemoglobin
VKALSDGHISTDGLKFLVTEQLAAAAGGPFKYTGRTMKNSHTHLMISSKEWEAGGKILKSVLDKFMVPAQEQGEIFTVIASLEKDIVKGG